MSGNQLVTNPCICGEFTDVEGIHLYSEITHGCQAHNKFCCMSVHVNLAEDHILDFYLTKEQVVTLRDALDRLVDGAI